MNHRKILAAAVSAALVPAAFAADITGPSSSESPYLKGLVPGVVIKSILTVGDSVNTKPDGVTPYRMVGIPDGLGAFDNGDGTFTVVMNHELTDSLGIERVHGAKGAFVSKWIIGKGSLDVVSGEDLIQRIGVWNGSDWDYKSGADGVAISRLCSADLPPVSAFYDDASGMGYNGYIFMNGEERGAEGLAYGHLLNGDSYQLPWLGRFSWENSVAHPDPGMKTVVVGLDDSGNGQVYVYIGTKTTSGDPIDAAGLTNGRLYGVKVEGYASEPDAAGIPSGTRFSLVDLGDVSGLTGAELEQDSNDGGVTGFQRPEDGAWNPQDLRQFIFATTAGFNNNSRLFRLNFEDPTDPTRGGTIDTLINGDETDPDVRMMDNLTVNDRGQVLIQEDPGGNVRLSKVIRYDISRDTFEYVAEHDPDRFLPGAPNFLTTNEESSGIIPAPFLGEGWYLADVQAHYSVGDAELVEGGQLLAIHVPPGKPVGQAGKRQGPKAR